MKLAYMAHPVSGNVEENLKSAKRWLRWLTESREEPMTFIAPWITDCEIWDDSRPGDRALGLARCMEVISRCDELWIVGGRISDGMRQEIAHAKRHDITTVNLTEMGSCPPPRTYD